MPKREPPTLAVADAVSLFLIRELHPEIYVRECKPWELLIAKPAWRHAKPLIKDNAARVRGVLEDLIAAQNGFPSSSLLMCLGKVLQASDEHDAAITVFRAVVERGEPEYEYKATYNVGKCQAALGDEAAARASFEDVLRPRPRDALAIRELVPILRRAGDHARADLLVGFLPDDDPLRASA